MHTSCRQSVARQRSHSLSSLSRDFCILRFENCHPAIDGSYTTTSLRPSLMFFVRIYHISCPCKNTCKKRMIKVLFIIMVADSPSLQQHIHLFVRFSLSLIPHGMKQRTPVTFFRAVIEPFDNSRFKDFLDFSVWDHKRYCTIRQLTIIIFFACFCQIAGKIQHTPKILL